MRKIIAALIMFPALALIQLSILFDPQPFAETATVIAKTIADRAGLELVEK